MKITLLLPGFIACLAWAPTIHAESYESAIRRSKTTTTRSVVVEHKEEDDDNALHHHHEEVKAELCIVINSNIVVDDGATVGKKRSSSRKQICGSLGNLFSITSSANGRTEDDNYDNHHHSLSTTAYITLDNLLIQLKAQNSLYEETSSISRNSSLNSTIQQQTQTLLDTRRFLNEDEDEAEDYYYDSNSEVLEEEEEEEEEEHEFERGELNATQTAICIIMTMVCTCVAALAAGLTIGMLSIEPLQLLIKMRVGTPEEKQHAEVLLPVVEQHHLLLVTLLLMNSMANEALPLFLDKLFPEYIAVLISVTLVLVFGEILPSAIFTGQKQIAMAAGFAPIVRGLMWFFYPIASPIARALDKFLGHSDSNVAEAFNRGEISALVRVIYEEQNRSKKETASTMLAAAATTLNASSSHHPLQRGGGINKMMSSRRHLHLDEVMMVEGALQMKTKTARDIYRPLDQVFAVNENTILDEDTVATLHACGHSRIPVYEDGPSGPEGEMTYDDENGKKVAIKGILLSRNLIVVDWSMNRKVNSLPLLRPHCVSPSTTLVDLINEFQKYGSHVGMAGHLAIVCHNPQLANKCLIHGNAIPVDAGVLGIVTLEDVIEELLQEEIVDESDKMEVATIRLARRVIKKWRQFVQRKKAQRYGITAVAAGESSNSTPVARN